MAYDFLFKLVLVGNSSVGKTSIWTRYVDDTFDSDFVCCLGVAFKVKTIEIDGKMVKLQVWDTAAQERFIAISTGYYRRAMGILLVYDVTWEKSFENVRDWLRNIEENAPADVEKIILGNKSDLQESRVVSMERGRLLAEEYGIKFMETSAKYDLNINSAFLTLAKDIKNKIDRKNVSDQAHPHSSIINVGEAGVEESNRPGCC